MKCEVVKLMTGGTAIVCGGQTVARKKPKPCVHCGAASTKLCDFPMKPLLSFGRVKGTRTCDAPICDKCAVSVDEDSDLCQTHAAMWRGGTPGRTNRSRSKSSY